MSTYKPGQYALTHTFKWGQGEVVIGNHSNRSFMWRGRIVEKLQVTVGNLADLEAEEVLAMFNFAEIISRVVEVKGDIGWPVVAYSASVDDIAESYSHFMDSPHAAGFLERFQVEEVYTEPQPEDGMEPPDEDNEKKEVTPTLPKDASNSEEAST